MFFNLKRISIAALALTAFIGGCGLRFGEKAPQEPAPSFSGQGYSCLAEIPLHVDLYVSDNLSETQFVIFVDCLKKAFTSFSQLTRGRDENTYAPEEIRAFLQSHFLKDRIISDAFLHELMVIKQTVVGGELDRITRPELYSAIELLEDIKKEGIRLKPFVRYLNPKLVVQQDPSTLGEKLKEAYSALENSIQTFISRFQGSKRPYELEHLGVLLSEGRNFVGWEQHFRDSKPVSAWLGLLKTFKALVVSPNHADQIGIAEWTPLLKATSRWYLAYLQFAVGIRDQNLLQGAGLQNTIFVGNEVFSLIEEALLRQPRQTIVYARILDLVSALHGLGWLPEGMRVESVMAVSRLAFNRIFGPDSAKPSKRESAGLTLPALARIRAEFYRWTAAQTNLETSFGVRQNEPIVTGVGRRNTPDLQMGQPDHSRALEFLVWTQDSDWMSLHRLKEEIAPMFSPALDRAYIVHASMRSKLGLTHDFYSLSMLNLLRTVVSSIFRGFAETSQTKDEAEQFITKAELQKFYEDVREIGIDLQLLDPRSRLGGERSFYEGNLFLFSSDGYAPNRGGREGGFNFIEAIEFFAYLYSGGVAGSAIYRDLAAACDTPAVKAPRDFNNKPYIGRPCAKELLPKALRDRAFHMPELIAYMEDLDEEARAHYIEALVAAAYSPSTSLSDWIEESELTTMMVIMQYSEAVMSRYDVNHDGFIKGREARAAVPVFVGYISEFAKEKMNLSLPESFADGAFMYILLHHRIPGVWNSPKVWWLSGDRPLVQRRSRIRGKVLEIDHSVNVSLDRQALANVFKVIISGLF